MTGFDGWHGDWTEPHSGGEPYDAAEPYDSPLDHGDPYHDGGLGTDAPGHEPGADHDDLAGGGPAAAGGHDGSPDPAGPDPADHGGAADGGTAHGGTAHGGTADGGTADGSAADGGAAHGGTADGSAGGHVPAQADLHAPGEHADPPTEAYPGGHADAAHPEPYTPEHAGVDPDPAAFAPPADAPDDPFPPRLDLDLAPADGQPWTDPDLLGAEPHGGAEAALAPTDPPRALLSDLAAADGGGHGPDGLAGSDDPAIRALAAYWSR